MKIKLSIFLFLVSITAHGQEKKTYFPAWTFQQKNITIYGVSVGLWNYSNDPVNTTTNGFRLSLIGEGILVPLAPRSPIPKNDSLFNVLRNDPFSERINGISIAGTGNAGSYEVNGITLGLVGHLNNSVKVTLLMNQSYHMNGVQIGLFNTSKKTRGLQIGLWNVNERRKLPIINWNFRS